jgi:hypothetical protein
LQSCLSDASAGLFGKISRIASVPAYLFIISLKIGEASFKNVRAKRTACAGLLECAEECRFARPMKGKSSLTDCMVTRSATDLRPLDAGLAEQQSEQAMTL